MIITIFLFNWFTIFGFILCPPPWVDMSLHSDTLFWFRANQSLLLLIFVACLIGEATNNNCLVFGLTQAQTHDLPRLWFDPSSNPWSTTSLVWPKLKPMIYHTRDEYTNHYTSHAIGYKITMLQIVDDNLCWCIVIYLCGEIENKISGQSLPA
jgi:hypothetical protein